MPRDRKRQNESDLQVRQESGASVRFSLDCSIRDIMSITPATEDDGQVQEVASR